MKNLLYSMLSAEGSERSQQVCSDIATEKHAWLTVYEVMGGVTCVQHELDPVYTPSHALQK